MGLLNMAQIPSGKNPCRRHLRQAQPADDTLYRFILFFNENGIHSSLPHSLFLTHTEKQ